MEKEQQLMGKGGEVEYKRSGTAGYAMPELCNDGQQMNTTTSTRPNERGGRLKKKEKEPKKKKKKGKKKGKKQKEEEEEERNERTTHKTSFSNISSNGLPQLHSFSATRYDGIMGMTRYRGSLSTTVKR